MLCVKRLLVVFGYTVRIEAQCTKTKHVTCVFVAAEEDPHNKTALGQRQSCASTSCILYQYHQVCSNLHGDVSYTTSRIYRWRLNYQNKRKNIAAVVVAPYKASFR